MMMDDEDGGPEHDAIQTILEMLESKGGELMKDKYAPKEDPKAMPVAHGHVVTVEVKPHAPGQEAHAEPDGDEDDITKDMLEHLLGGGDDGDDKD
jgi:hypothetical protein